jgi:hypothetical protein
MSLLEQISTTQDTNQDTAGTEREPLDSGHPSSLRPCSNWKPHSLKFRHLYGRLSHSHFPFKFLQQRHWLRKGAHLRFAIGVSASCGTRPRAQTVLHHSLQISKAALSWYRHASTVSERANAWLTLPLERVRASHVVAPDDTILPMLSKRKNSACAHVRLCGRCIATLQHLRLHTGSWPRWTGRFLKDYN